jgi:hypothetical protein
VQHKFFTAFPLRVLYISDLLDGAPADLRKGRKCISSYKKAGQAGQVPDRLDGAPGQHQKQSIFARNSDADRWRIFLIAVHIGIRIRHQCACRHPALRPSSGLSKSPAAVNGN